ncbi:hypothetical protein H9P43_002758 [Blastocladiella emersonii ATCC 22665]|nr:hypothetical protein H9P43_002758 [Blastocladiella emersonii ATCC 22665]
MNRSVSSLSALSENLLERLSDAGFRRVRDLQGLDPAVLVDGTSQVKLSSDEAAQVLAAVDEAAGEAVLLTPSSASGGGGGGGGGGPEFLPPPLLSTGCTEIDALLGSPDAPGLAPGRIYELSGVPAIGTTEICLQLALRVQLAPSLGGLHGRALWLDTESSFLPSRAAEIAAHLSPALADPALLLANIAVYRLHDLLELIALMDLLPSILTANPGVRLVVLDSLSFLLDATGAAGRETHVLSALRAAATHAGVVVVVTSKMEVEGDAVVGVGGVGQVAEAERALGYVSPMGAGRWTGLVDVQAVACWDLDTRVMFTQRGGQRNRFARFRITDAGVVTHE